MKIVRLLLYFLLVFLIGGLGCWISLGQYLHDPTNISIFSFVSNLGTFSISVAVMAFADFLLMSNNSYNSTRALFFLVMMAVAVIASSTSLFLREQFMVYIAWGALILAFIEWWVVHWKNPTFDEPVDPVSSLGGKI